MLKKKKRDKKREYQGANPQEEGETKVSKPKTEA